MLVAGKASHTGLGLQQSKRHPPVVLWRMLPPFDLVEATVHFAVEVLDAMHVKVRRQGAVRSTTVMLAVGINAAGYREILGLETAFGETGDAWRRFIEGLKRRGLSGVEVATSDTHEGLRSALASAFPDLIWQRCQAHFRRNVIDQTPATLRDRMHEMLDQVLGACSPERAREAVEAAYDELEGKADQALKVLEAGFEDTTAVLRLPAKYRRRLRTTNMVERFIEEIRRRETVIRIFPNLASAQRLVGALCAEQYEEWSTGRRYLIMDEFFEWKRQVESGQFESSSSSTDSDPSATAMHQQAQHAAITT